MIDVLGALMGIDMQGFSRPEGSDEVPPGVPGSASSPPSTPPPSAKPTPAASSSKAPEPEDVKMAEAEEAEADDEDAAAKKAAEAEKKLGAEAYKKRDFTTAITHFNKAWETWPKDTAYLTNLAGGYWSVARRVSAQLAQRRTLSKAITTRRLKHARRPLTRAERYILLLY